MPDVPKIRFPFFVPSEKTNAIYQEQDSDAEIIDCVTVLLGTEVGERLDVPAYGIVNPVFRENGVDIDSLLVTIRRWEPRAPAVITREEFVDMTDRIRIAVRARGESTNGG